MGFWQNGTKSAVVASGYSNKWRKIIIFYANEIVNDCIKKYNAGLGSPITQATPTQNVVSRPPPASYLSIRIESPLLSLFSNYAKKYFDFS